MVETLRGASGSPRVPRALGRYELLAHLASGGMAEVFLARTRSTGALVCIKRVLPDLARDPAYRNMFVDEGKLALRWQHPNLVPAFELVENAEQPYLAMEYIAGETLASLQRRLVYGEPLADAVIAYIVTEAAAGLHAAHTATGPDGASLAVVHRDVSPQNILLGYDGRVHVIDFGVADARTHRTEHDDAAALKGKFGYMAPEQLDGGTLDARTDVFGLGVILYEVLTGKRLYAGHDPTEMMKVIALSPIKPPRELAVVDPGLDAIAMKALAMSKSERFATAEELRAALSPWCPSLRDAQHILATRLQKEFAERIQQKLDAARPIADYDDTIPMLPRGSSMPVQPPRAPSPLPSLVGANNSDPPTSILTHKPTARPVDEERKTPPRRLQFAVSAFVLLALASSFFWFWLR